MAFLTRNISITNSNGIVIDTRRGKIFLDPDRTPQSGVSFISHAHLDHIHSSFNGKKVIASSETVHLAKKRGFNIDNYDEEGEDMETSDAGHILGSRGVLIESTIFYTGDFSLRDRAFLSAGKTPKCDTLIMETTFGSPEYVFPPITKVLEETNKLIADLFSSGIPVVLMGYPLGKSQILSHYFSIWDPVYICESIAKMNQAHVDLGVNLGNGFRSYEEASEKGMLDRKPWVLFSSLMSGRSKFLKELRERYGAILVAFSGWACRPGYKYAMNVDHAFPMSDHCGFDELLQLVGRCSPERVITVHGQNVNFANYLRKQGYDARPLEALQPSISDYVHED